MARPGDVIENPITGERITFLTTRAESAGELLRMELRVRGHGFVVTEHVHLSQEERFDVREGHFTFKVDGTTRRAGAGELVVVRPGQRHTWWNAEDDPAVAVLELRPALQAETVFETIFGLARDGKTNAKGMPGLLQLAVLSVAADGYVAGPPIWLQRAAMRILALAGRAFGYRDRYDAYSK